MANDKNGVKDARYRADDQLITSGQSDHEVISCIKPFTVKMPGLAQTMREGARVNAALEPSALAPVPLPSPPK